MTFKADFQVQNGRLLDLASMRTKLFSGSYDKMLAKQNIDRNRDRLAAQQARLYGNGRQSLLLCFQGMDGAGKDGVIGKLASGLNPMGCETHSFKQPSAEESSHDFLWRIHKATPPHGKIGIFNRSHYEAVLVERVKNLVPENVWRKRYDQIREFEQLLTQNGTVVLKFFLHISKEEQLQRFKDRLDDPLKQWKISTSDYSDRLLWDEYQHAYADALSKCSTENAPWFIIPSDRKWFRDLAVSEIVADAMEAMHIPDPKPSVDIEAIRKRYHAAADGVAANGKA